MSNNRFSPEAWTLGNSFFGIAGSAKVAATMIYTGVKVRQGSMSARGKSGGYGFISKAVINRRTGVAIPY